MHIIRRNSPIHRKEIERGRERGRERGGKGKEEQKSKSGARPRRKVSGSGIYE